MNIQTRMPIKFSALLELNLDSDIRNKKQLVERKSVYAEMQSQLEQMTEAMKDREGTIETLERQLVQAGIKMKVGDASNEIRKDVMGHDEN